MNLLVLNQLTRKRRSLAPQNISKQKESKDQTISHDESEIKLGTYWLSNRVLLLLTGLATLWFKDFSGSLRWNKVALFYTLSLGMGGVGLFTEEKNFKTLVRSLSLEALRAPTLRLMQHIFDP